MPLFDAHVHFGQYKERYWTPPQLAKWAGAVGIDRFAAVSTSAIITDDPGLMAEERQALVDWSDCRGIPVLWITQSMLRKSPDLSMYIDENVAALKVHGASEPWAPMGKRLQRVFGIARERNLPIQLHTGEYENCMAAAYLPICRLFPEVKVDLVHGRPVAGAIEVLRECPNVFVDTAFMPHDDLRLLLSNGFADRVMFGTDLPVQQVRLKSSLPAYLRRRIETSRRIAGPHWRAIAWDNANRFFGKKQGTRARDARIA